MIELKIDKSKIEKYYLGKGSYITELKEDITISLMQITATRIKKLSGLSFSLFLFSKDLFKFNASTK